ncbi:beta-glucosidase H [Sporobolomyces koalae]|uniref:beta-glucosidase H n=1 Tax=Sporobolomyces koalae TaxID=500713 RepID=UPI00317B1015
MAAPLSLEQYASADLHAVLDSLTVAEKVSLLAGADWWNTVPIPRVGVPKIKCSDGPNGVRGSSHFNPTPATCIPAATALGATFDTDLINQVGGLLARECVAKGSSLLLAPTCNIQRNPLNGRAFESFSEDPHLSGHITAAYINGLQDNGIGACPKHFVCNDSEHERMSCSSEVGARALREIYLKPFQIAQRLSRPWSIMTGYNRLNGVFCSEDKSLLQGILRDEWKFDGMVMSDWTGTYSTDLAIEAGLDLEMPGPALFRGQLAIKQLQTNKITERAIDARAFAILQLVQRSVQADIELVRHNSDPEQPTNNPDDRALNRRVAAEAIVLLKNSSGVLPLSRDEVKSVLVIGPNAKVRTVSGGGSAYLTSNYVVTPLEGIQTGLEGTAAQVKYAPGCYAHKFLPMMDGSLFTADGKPGWTFSFYNDPPEAGKEPVAVHVMKGTRLRINDEKPAGLGDLFYVSAEGRFTPDQTGPFEFGVSLVGRAYLYINDKLVLDNGMETEQTPGSSFYGLGTIEETVKINVKAGNTYKVRVEYTNVPRPVTKGSSVNKKQPALMMAAFRLGGAPYINEDDSIAEAVELARTNDGPVVCVIGTSMDWEAEASDRESLDLPGRTNELVSRVLDANPNTIIVNQSGSVVTFPWVDKANTLLQSWFGGDETGNGIFDVLFGKVNPSAKLPLTFYKTINQCTAHLNWGSESGRTLYGEGVFVGYRGVLETQRTPTFEFGHGLSYTSFDWSDFSISGFTSAASADDLAVKVSVKVTNTGSLAGRDVVQVFVSDLVSSFRRPIRELKAFAKTKLLQPGQSQVVTLALDKYAFSMWDDTESTWLAEKGEFRVAVATSSADKAQVDDATIELKSSFRWKGL